MGWGGPGEGGEGGEGGGAADERERTAARQLHPPLGVLQVRGDVV